MNTTSTTTSTQSREEIAAILGRVRINCPAVNYALYRAGSNFKVIGRVFGDSRYTGARKLAAIRAEYPSFEFITEISHGRTAGTTEFAVYASR